MAEITASVVKDLREKTGAGMMDCKKALVEADGNEEKAIELLRKKGLKNVDKRAGKVAAEGTIGTYIHQGAQIVAIVELNCETDFVARGDDFKTLAKDIAMHVAAMNPQYVNVEDVPEEVINKEKEILIEQLNDKQKSKADMIIPGKLEKFYSENVLLKQIFVKDEEQTVASLIQNLSAKIGEKIVVRRFVRFQVGEGIEKKQEDFAAEVAAQCS